MKRVLLAVCSVVFALAVSVGDAQAARLGGGKSVGMQRQAVAPKRVETPQQAQPAQQAAPAPAPAPGASAPAPKRNWLGPVAGLAAGLGLAALASHFGFGEGLANFLTIALLAMAVVLVLKWLLRRKASAQSPRDALQYAGADPAYASQPPTAVTQSAGSLRPSDAENPLANVPAGFDSAAFLRVAKVNFVRLQAANDAKNLDDLREFVSPEMYAEIKMAMDERGNAPQQTEVVTLEAELLEVVSEGNCHVASVHFSGMLREAAGVPATHFSEVWNLAKPVSGERGWVVAGIQQLG